MCFSSRHPENTRRNATSSRGVFKRTGKRTCPTSLWQTTELIHLCMCPQKLLPAHSNLVNQTILFTVCSHEQWSNKPLAKCDGAIWRGWQPLAMRECEGSASPFLIRVVWVDTFLAKNSSVRNLHASAVQPGMAPTCDGSWLQERQMPIVVAAFRNQMWWAMPEDLSAEIYEKYLMGWQEVSFVWSWSNGRQGTWTNNGEATNLNRYVIDFNQMVQKNSDSGGQRSIRIVWPAPTDQSCTA